MPRAEMIYLDNNATTQLDPAVIEEMLPFFTKYYANPSSGYAIAAEVRKAVELARARLAALLDCEPSEIVFTSCGTESNNAAINAALQHEPRGKHIVISAVEHSAVRRHCEELSRRGCELTFVGVDRAGNLDLAEIEQAIRPNTALLSMMWANNETGVVFPVEKVAATCRQKGVLFHTDAVQAVGKVTTSLRGSAINFLALSAHKFHGPKGVGALYVHRRSPFSPTQIGGSHENGRRAGTENVASIVGMGKAAERAAECINEEGTRVRAMRDRFERGMLDELKGVSINGAQAERLPNTSSCSFDAIEAHTALTLLDRHYICCSAGSACRTGAQDSSHVLLAMGLSAERARGGLRFSFGRFNSEDEVGQAIEIVPRVIHKLRELSEDRRKRSSASAR
jgi:cysteine desulfurase